MKRLNKLTKGLSINSSWDKYGFSRKNLCTICWKRRQTFSNSAISFRVVKQKTSITISLHNGSESMNFDWRDKLKRELNKTEFATGTWTLSFGLYPNQIKRGKVKKKNYWINLEIFRSETLEKYNFWPRFCFSIFLDPSDLQQNLKLINC